jgi:hypothetical protein
MKKYFSLSILVFNTICFSQTPNISESNTKSKVEQNKQLKEYPEIKEGDTIRLNKLVSDLADSIVKKAEWQSIVGKNAADEIELVLKDTIDAESAAYLKILVDNYKSIIDREIADATADGRTVPDSLRKLSDELGEKSKQADYFLKKGN